MGVEVVRAYTLLFQLLLQQSLLLVQRRELVDAVLIVPCHLRVGLGLIFTGELTRGRVVSLCSV